MARKIQTESEKKIFFNSNKIQNKIVDFMHLFRHQRTHL